MIAHDRLGELDALLSRLAASVPGLVSRAAAASGIAYFDSLAFA